MAIFHRLLPRTLAACLRDLNDPAAKVRRSAIVDLARLVSAQPTAAMTEALQKAVGDDDPIVRTEAAYALGDAQAAHALPSLLMAVDDEHPLVRQAAIESLGRIGDSRATSRLLRALRDDRPDVRFQAIIALGRVAPTDAREALFDTARDEDPHVRYVSVRVAEELCSAGQQGAVSQVRLDDRLRAAARGWLGDEQPSVRLAAAILLARSGDLAGADCLIGAVGCRLRGVDPEDEATAVEMVGTLELRDAMGDLERRAFGLKRWTRECYSWLALVSLARMGHLRARNEILRDLTAWSRSRRTTAVAAAGKARLGDALEIIEKMRGDESQADPAAVDEALGQLRAPGC
jgi:hypothetical protein